MIYYYYTLSFGLLKDENGCSWNQGTPSKTERPHSRQNTELLRAAKTAPTSTLYFGVLVTELL